MLVELGSVIRISVRFGRLFWHAFGTACFLAHLELIVYQSSQSPSVRASTLLNINISETDCNQILSEASLGWGKSCIRFLARSDWNSGFHGNGYSDSSHRVIMGKILLAL